MSDPRPSGLGESWFSSLDRALRGSYLDDADLAAGRLALPVGRLVALGAVLGAIYGACLGTPRAFRGDGFEQVVASAAKVPLLFVLTLLVTFPSLYVFIALQRLSLNCGALLRVVLLAIVVHLGVVASLGPVFVFFAASTPSYPFLLLLNVAFFALGGLIGIMVLRRATRSTAEGEPSRRLIGIWGMVYAIVGAQMGWLLRPFLGRPEVPFAWLRPTEDNVLLGILRAIGELLGR